jgi:hypothetical protein
MHYIFASLLYWPVYLYLDSWAGIIGGAALVVACWHVMWRIDWGTWRLGR